MDITHLRNALGTIDARFIAAIAKRMAYHTNSQLYQTSTPVASPQALSDELALQPDARAKTPFMRSFYTGIALPLLCKDGADENANECLGLDMECLNALAHRLNFSNWIARSKEQTQTLQREDLEASITNPQVEQAVLTRVALCGRESGLQEEQIACLQMFYRDWIIPTSRLIQVARLS